VPSRLLCQVCISGYYFRSQYAYWGCQVRVCILRLGSDPNMRTSILICVLEPVRILGHFAYWYRHIPCKYGKICLNAHTLRQKRRSKRDHVKSRGAKNRAKTFASTHQGNQYCQEYKRIHILLNITYTSDPEDELNALNLYLLYFTTSLMIILGLPLGTLPGTTAKDSPLSLQGSREAAANSHCCKVVTG
jgi:hypothetical protein